MIKHCLGDSEINLIPEWRVFLLNKRKSLGVQQARADIIHSNREIKEIFDPEKLPFPLTQSIKVHRRALVLLPCLIPCLRCEKSEENLATLTIFDHATWQHTRGNPRHARLAARIYDVRMSQLVIVPYHGSPRIPLTLRSPSPIHGSCSCRLKVDSFTYHFLCRDDSWIIFGKKIV